MAFLRIDGFAVDVMIDGFDITNTPVEAYGRALNDSLEGVTYSEKKEISFTTEPLRLEDAQAMEGWIRGLQSYWSFEKTYNPATGVTTAFTKMSADAGFLFSGGTLSAVSTLWASQLWTLALLSAATGAATTSFGSEGNWTIHGYHIANANGPWRSFGLRYVGGTPQAYLGGASISTLPFLSYSTASGYLGVLLAGKNTSGTAATAQYTALSMSKFAWTEGMLLAASTPQYGLASTGYVRKPFVSVTGDALQGRLVACNGAGEQGPMVAKGFVESFSVQPVVVDGVFRYNARALQVTLTEK